MDPFDSSPGIDSDAAFNLTVQISQFTAKLDDGSTVDVQRKCIKWVVDYCTYTLDKLEKDLAARVNWGSCQRPKISEFDMSTFEERELMDETSLALAFSNRMAEKTLMLFVDVEEKDIELISASIVTEGAQSNVVADNASALVASSNQTEVAHVIDWDSLHIVPIAEDQIGTLASVMDEDAMYAFVGLRVEDETTEKERQDVDAENENGAGTENTEGAAYGTGNTDGEDLLVDDIIPGVIKPLPDKTQWAQVDLGFKVMPPLAKRAVGRQRKNRIPGCLENKGNNPRTKGVFQVQCKTCLEFGHRSSSPKCCFNGPKKRKSRAKKQGAPRGSNKRKKTAAKNPSPEPENEISTTPTRPVTRSQLQLTMQDGARTHAVAACTNSPGPVTRSMQLAVLDGEGTSKSPAKKRTPRLTKFPAKKITPRKGKK